MNKKSLFHISKRDTLPWYTNVAIRGGAIILALVVCALVTTILTGENPLSIYGTILKGAFGTARKSWTTWENVAILLGILFENQNIAFMVGLAFSIAASCNFPIILLSMYWSKLTTRGAMIGGWLGLLTAVILMILGPTIWVQILGHASAIFPYEYPALFSIAVAFIGIWVFSATDNSLEGNLEREKFRAQFIRSQTGLGVEQGRAH